MINLTEGLPRLLPNSLFWRGGGAGGLCQTLITKQSTPSAQDLLLKAKGDQEPKKSTINL